MSSSASPSRREIGVEEGVGERPHRQLRPADVAPDRRAGLEDHGGGRSSWRPAAQRAELLRAPRRDRAACRRARPPQTEHLVGAEHQRLGRPARDPPRLELGQRVGDVARRAPSASIAALTAASSTRAGTASNGTPARAQQRGARRRARGENQRRHGQAGRTVGGHRGGTYAATAGGGARPAARAASDGVQIPRDRSVDNPGKPGAAAVDRSPEPGAAGIRTPSRTGSAPPTLRIRRLGITRIPLHSGDENDPSSLWINRSLILQRY